MFNIIKSFEKAHITFFFFICYNLNGKPYFIREILEEKKKKFARPDKLKIIWHFKGHKIMWQKKELHISLKINITNWYDNIFQKKVLFHFHCLNEKKNFFLIDSEKVSPKIMSV